MERINQRSNFLSDIKGNTAIEYVLIAAAIAIAIVAVVFSIGNELESFFSEVGSILEKDKNRKSDSTIFTDTFLLLTFLGLMAIGVFTISVIFFRFVRQFILRRGAADFSELASAEREQSSAIESLRRDLVSRIDSLEKKTNNLDISELTANADAIIEVKLDEELGSDIVAALGERVAKQAKDHADRIRLIQSISDLFNLNRIRILDQTLAAQRTAVLFRLIGLALSLSGIAIAAYSLILYFSEDATLSGTVRDLTNAVSANEPGGRSSVLFMFRHLPFTLPFIILAEVLALIMFRYQSKALEMMRYFSNEATTLSLRQAGALLAIEHGTLKQVSELSKELLQSERNIIMRKDEKTIELAQNRDEDAMVNSLLEKLTTALKRNSNDKNEKSH